MTARGPSSIYSTLLERRAYLAVAAAVFLVDRLTKTLVHTSFSVGESRTVIEGLFDLVYFRNTGVAFGIFSSGNTVIQALLLSALALGAAVLVIVYSVRTPAHETAVQSALALILGGALGNLFDRLVFGFVIDFFYFHLGQYSWPAFNVADMAITAGVLLMLLGIVHDEIRDRSPA